jgi:hypothetical protein
MPVTPFEIMASKVWSMGLVVLGRRGGVAGRCVVQGLLAVPIQGSIALFLLAPRCTSSPPPRWASSSPPSRAACRSSACC